MAGRARTTRLGRIMLYLLLALIAIGVLLASEAGQEFLGCLIYLVIFAILVVVLLGLILLGIMVVQEAF